MTKGLRWRVLILQVGLIGILAFVSGFLFWAAGFTHDQVTTQLAGQQITFPAANSSSITSLPAADAAAMRQYAGEVMTTGPQAETYADHFIKVHLSKMPTYEQASGAARANPKDAAAAATLNTVFTGVSLRSMLLNAYGWWTIGTYALYAGIGLAVAAFAVLLALAFELYRWVASSREEARLQAPAPAGYSPTGAAAHPGLARFSKHDS